MKLKTNTKQMVLYYCTLNDNQTYHFTAPILLQGNTKCRVEDIKDGAESNVLDGDRQATDRDVLLPEISVSKPKKLIHHQKQVDKQDVKF